MDYRETNRDRKVKARRTAQPTDNRRSIQNIMRAIAKRAEKPGKAVAR